MMEKKVRQKKVNKVLMEEMEQKKRSKKNQFIILIKKHKQIN